MDRLYYGAVPPPATLHILPHKEGSKLSTTTRTKQRRKPPDVTDLPKLRTSERTTLKACEFRWEMTYNKQSQPVTTAPALRFGSLVHGALAAYYKPGVKRGPHPAKTFARLYNKELETAEAMGFRDEDGKWQEAGSLGEAILNNYVEEYGADDKWEVIATEMPFQVTVYKPWTYDPNHPVEAQDAEPWFNYVGVLDGVWRNRSTKRLWIPDHKTTSGIGGTVDHPSIPPYLLMDDQAGAYWSYGVEYLIGQEILKKNQKLAGMLFNFIRKAMPDERPYKIVKGKRLHLNMDGSVSKRQPPPFFFRCPIQRDEFDREYAKQRATEEYRRIELLRSGELTFTKTPGMFTCSTCSVRDVCELHETGSDWESMFAATMQPWDPYAQHEIREGR